MHLKLSSTIMISEASFATSVPAIFMAKPTSDFFKAGASLVPSPVTATVCPNYIRPVTSKNLSSGEDLASTRRVPSSFFISSILATFGYTFSRSVESYTIPPTIYLNSLPSIISPALGFSPMILQFLAIAVAVSRESPVTILTVIPERCVTISIISGTP